MKDTAVTITLNVNTDSVAVGLVLGAIYVAITFMEHVLDGGIAANYEALTTISLHLGEISINVDRLSLGPLPSDYIVNDFMNNRYDALIQIHEQLTNITGHLLPGLHAIAAQDALHSPIAQSFMEIVRELVQSNDSLEEYLDILRIYHNRQ
jgi:hypothetical protein